MFESLPHVQCLFHSLADNSNSVFRLIDYRDFVIKLAAF
jgi:hypothetical protein